MFKFTGLFTTLLIVSPFSFASNEKCEIKITANIPNFAEKFNLNIVINHKDYPVSRKSPSICVTKKTLNVYPLKYSSASVELMINKNGKKGGLFRSRIHLQKNEIFIDHKTSIASLVCPYNCGFYEYQQLISDPDIIKISDNFLKNISNNPEVLLSREKIRTFYSSYLQQTEGIYDRYLKTNINLPEIPVHKGYYSVSYSSGFRKYWSTYLNKSNYFDTLIKPEIKNLPKDKQFESVYPDYKKYIINATSPVESWDEKKKIIHTASSKLSKSKNKTLKIISKLFLETIDNVEARVNNILNDNSIKFDILSDETLSSEKILAHWFRFSYHYANDIEKFPSLFSRGLKKRILNNIKKDNSLDRSLSRIIARYGRLLVLFGKKDDLRVYKRLIHEYQGVGKVINGRLTIEDKLEKISLLYENGAWRLDDFSIDYF